MIKYVAIDRDVNDKLGRYTQDSIVGIVCANDIFEASDLASQEYNLSNPIFVKFDDSCVEDSNREVASKKLPIMSALLKQYRN